MPPKSKTRSKPPTTTSAPVAHSQTPNWPPFHPLLPRETQSLTSLLPSQILTTPLLTSSLSQTYRHFLSTLPFTTTPATAKKGYAARVNDRYQITDPLFAQRLWSETGLSSLVLSSSIDGEDISDAQRQDLWGGQVLGLSDNIRIYRYRPGQFFDAHYDDFNIVTFTAEDGEKVKGRTTWTLLVYLSGPVTGCEGGETVFYPNGKKGEPVVADLQVGLALLHRHGEECLLHEGREVTRGEKWVIRSDLVVGR